MSDVKCDLDSSAVLVHVFIIFSLSLSFKSPVAAKTHPVLLNKIKSRIISLSCHSVLITVFNQSLFICVFDIPERVHLTSVSCD